MSQRPPKRSASSAHKPERPPRAAIGSSNILGADVHGSNPGASERLDQAINPTGSQVSSPTGNSADGFFFPEERGHPESGTPSSPLSGVFPAIEADAAGAPAQRLLDALRRSGREPQIRDVIARASLLKLLNTPKGRTLLTDAFERLFLTGQVVKGKRPNTVRLGENAPVLRST